MCVTLNLFIDSSNNSIKKIDTLMTNILFFAYPVILKRHIYFRLTSFRVAKSPIPSFPSQYTSAFYWLHGSFDTQYVPNEASMEA